MSLVRQGLTLLLILVIATPTSILSIRPNIALAATAVTDTFSAAGYTTWTAPDGVTSVTIACWGGGAAGQLAINNSGGGPGGGGGAFASSTQSVTAGDVIRIFVGAGGASSGAFGATSTASTSAGVLIVSAAAGWAGKAPVNNVNQPGGLGGAVASSTGTTRFAGGAGGRGTDGGNNQDYGGGGGGAAGPHGAGAAGALGASGGVAGGRGDNNTGGTGGTNTGNGTASTLGGGGGGGGNDSGAAGDGGTYGAGGGGSGVSTAGSFGAGATGACTMTYSVTKPAVTTSAATSILASSANLNGSITANPATTEGYAYGTDANLVAGVSTTSNSGTYSPGSFLFGISSLNPSTTYYFRAFATNADGTGYGSILNFTTTAANTTLADLADPSSATVAPGENAVYADGFSFATDVSSDSITALTLNLGSGAYQGVGRIDITDAAASTTFGSMTDPNSDTPTITLAKPITATTTASLYKIFITPKSHANMPPVPGSSYAVQAVVSSFTSTNNHAGSDTVSPTITIDNTSPNDATSATASAGAGQVSLSWTNSSSGDFAENVVLRSTTPIATSTFEGTRYSTTGGFASNSISGGFSVNEMSITRMSSTTVAFANDVSGQISMFSSDGTSLSSLGGTSVSSMGSPAITSLNSTDVAFIDDSNSSLRTYRWNGSSWSQVGTGKSITVATPSLAGLNGTDVALLDTTNKKLAVYRFNGSTWSEVGASTTISSTVRPRITALSSTTVAFTDSSGSQELRTYSWNGTSWSQVGSSFDLSGNNPSNGYISTLSSTTIVLATGGNAMTTYKFNGSTWSQVGLTASIPSSGPQYVAALNATDVALYEASQSMLTMYRFDSVNWTQNKNVVASSTVACVTTSNSCTDTGLTAGTPYYYKIFTRDTSGNYSAGVTPTGSPVTPTAPATTLADSTDPSSSTLAPGETAVTADKFTLVSGGANDNVTAVVVGLGTGASAGIARIDITDAAASTTYGSISDPNSDTPSITLAKPITATSSATLYQIRITPKSHSNMPPVPGASYSVTAKINSFTPTSNSTAGSDTAGTTLTIDNASPSDASNATAVNNGTIANLAWTNSASSDFAENVVLRSTSPIATSTFEGTRYATSGTFSDLSISNLGGIATARLSSTTIAIYNSNSLVLITYTFNGTGWSSTGSGKSITPSGTPSMTALNSTDIAFYDPIARTLSMYRWNGSVWTQLGGNVSIGGSAGFGPITALNSTDVALLDSTNDSLGLYRFNGSTWSLVGSGLSVSNVGVSLAALSSTTIAIENDTFGSLQAYRFNGSAWATVGNSLTGLSSVILTALSSTTVAAGGPSGALTTYAFDGTNWKQVGNTATVASASTLLPVMLNASDVAVVDSTTDTLRTYRWDSVNWTQNKNAVASSTVVCVTTSSSCTDSGLDSNTTYYYKLFTRDTSGNYSAGVTVVNAYTTVGTTGTQATSLLIGTTSAFLGGAFTFSTTFGTTTLQRVTLSQTGTISASANLTNIKLYFKQEPMCEASLPSDATLFATSTFSSANQATFTPQGSNLWRQGGAIIYSNNPAGYEWDAAVATDTQGNMYVAGTIYKGGSDYDMAVRKYDSNGNLVTAWGNGGVITYNDPTNGADNAETLLLAPDGSLYLAGSANISGSATDMVVIKYDSTGATSTSWGTNGIVSYNGSAAASTDVARAIALDPDGSLYMAGYAAVTGQLTNMIVIKFDSTGATSTGWGTSGVITYNGTANSSDQAYALALASDGSLYVGGYTTVSGQLTNMIVIKYDSTGATSTGWGTQGVKTYNGAANGNDAINALTLASDGSLYVGGYTTVSGQLTNMIVIKYNSSGATSTGWATNGVRTYNDSSNGGDGVINLVLASDGSLYVAGYAANNGTYTDGTIIKYNSSGATSTSWGVNGIATYNGGYGYDQYFDQIIFDASGNLYAVGENVLDNNFNNARWNIVSYDSSGHLRDGGSVWGTSGVVSFTPTGGNSDAAYAMARDSAGNVYVAGTESPTFGNTNIMIRKYDSTGALDTTWASSGVYIYANPSNSNDTPQALALAPDGSLYVGGYTNISGQQSNFIVIKLDSTGATSTSWATNGVYTYNGTANGVEIVNALALAPDGSLYVGGRTDVTGQSQNAIVVKLDPTGATSTSWAANGVYTYNNTTNTGDLVNTLALAPDGSLYVGGYFFNFSNANLSVVKLDSTGATSTGWATQGRYTYVGPNGGDTVANALALAPDGSLYVGGYQSTTNYGHDGVLIKLDSSGAVATSWGRSGKVSYNGSVNNTDHFNALALAPDGSLYAGGYSVIDVSNNYNAIVFKVDATGATSTSWGTNGVANYHTVTGGGDIFNAMILTSDGSLYGAGSASNASFGTLVWIVIRFNSSGTLGSQPLGTNIGTSQTCGYVVLDVGTSTAEGQTIDIEITNPSTDTTVYFGSVTPSSAVAISGSTAAVIIHLPASPGGGGEIGGAAPAGQGIVSGGSGAGDSGSGEEIGSEPGFNAPTASIPSNGWAALLTGPANAYSSDDVYATRIGSQGAYDYSSFGFNIPAGNQVVGVVVKLEGKGSTVAGSFGVEFSWNNGTATTTSNTTSNITSTSDVVYTLGSPTSLFGRTWAPSEFSDANFRVRIIANPSGGNTLSLDAIQVRVYYQAGGGGGGGGGEI